MDFSVLGHATGSGNVMSMPTILWRDDALLGGLMRRMAREWVGSTSFDSDALMSLEQVPGSSWGAAPWGRFDQEPIKGGYGSFLMTPRLSAFPTIFRALHYRAFNLLSRGCEPVQHVHQKQEEALVGRCLAGDAPAWESFLNSNYRTIWSIVSWRKWGFDAAEKEDVTQDVLEELIKSLGNFEFRARVNTFVHRISVTTCIAYLRKKTALKRGAKSRHLSIDPVTAEGDDPEIHTQGNPFGNPEELLLKRESLAQVKQALACLEAKCRDLIRFRYFKELSFREIADKTGVKENTLVVNLRRCLLRLFDLLQTAG